MTTKQQLIYLTAKVVNNTRRASGWMSETPSQTTYEMLIKTFSTGYTMDELIDQISSNT